MTGGLRMIYNINIEEIMLILFLDNNKLQFQKGGKGQKVKSTSIS